MAVDKTEPPIKVIVTVGAISLGVLVAMRMFFVSYFNDSYEARSRAHIDAMLRGGSYVYTAGRVQADEARRLSGLPAAMTAVGRGQRPGAISPTASADLAPLQGWTLMPLEVPRPAPVAAPAPAAAPAAVAPAVVAPAAAAAPAAVPAPAAAAPAHPAVAPGAH
nr:hypothetical protein [Deltaproteobacteria bacterium]